MRIFVAVFLLLSAFVILSSCASLTKEECLSSDWNAIGQRDGALGEHPQRQFERHVAACQKANVIVDHALWWQGYQNGLIRYCTPLNGLSVGQQGKTYYEVCPPETDFSFERGYWLGKKEYSIRSTIKENENNISSLNQDMEKLVNSMKDAMPTEVSKISSEIRDKQIDIKGETRDMKRNFRRLSRIERIVERFLAYPDMDYDPIILEL